jgi:hypothetical protein
MVVETYNPSTGETKAGGLLYFKANLGYIARPN